MEQQQFGQWPISVEIPVAWGEMDALGHVNNTVYLRWFETARIGYFHALGIATTMHQAGEGPILARQAIDYRRPVVFPDAVAVETTVTGIGRTSFVMAFRIRSQTHRAIVAEGEGVFVMVRYKDGEKVPVTDDLRRTILEVEARGLAPVLEDGVQS